MPRKDFILRVRDFRNLADGSHWVSIQGFVEYNGERFDELLLPNSPRFDNSVLENYRRRQGEGHYLRFDYPTELLKVVGSRLKLNPAPATISEMKDFPMIVNKVFSWTNPLTKRRYLLLEIEEQKLFLSEADASSVTPTTINYLLLDDATVEKLGGAKKLISQVTADTGGTVPPGLLSVSNWGKEFILSKMNWEKVKPNDSIRGNTGNKNNVWSINEAMAETQNVPLPKNQNALIISGEAFTDFQLTATETKKSLARQELSDLLREIQTKRPWNMTGSEGLKEVKRYIKLLEKYESKENKAYNWAWKTWNYDLHNYLTNNIGISDNLKAVRKRLNQKEVENRREIKFYDENDGETGFLSNYYPLPATNVIEFLPQNLNEHGEIVGNERVPNTNNLYWRTGEHVFQAMKFTQPKEEMPFGEVLWNARNNHLLSVQKKITADEAKTEAKLEEGLYDIEDWWYGGDFRTPGYNLRVMRWMVREKFNSGDLRVKLLDTEKDKLIENTQISHREPKDNFWGNGANGKGQNWLGRVLMETRARFEIEEAIRFAIHLTTGYRKGRIKAEEWPNRQADAIEWLEEIINWNTEGTEEEKFALQGNGGNWPAELEKWIATLREVEVEETTTTEEETENTTETSSETTPNYYIDEELVNDYFRDLERKSELARPRKELVNIVSSSDWLIFQIKAGDFRVEYTSGGSILYNVLSEKLRKVFNYLVQANGNDKLNKEKFVFKFAKGSERDENGWLVRENWGLSVIKDENSREIPLWCLEKIDNNNVQDTRTSKIYPDTRRVKETSFEPRNDQWVAINKKHFIQQQTACEASIYEGYRKGQENDENRQVEYYLADLLTNPNLLDSIGKYSCPKTKVKTTKKNITFTVGKKLPEILTKKLTKKVKDVVYKEGGIGIELDTPIVIQSNDESIQITRLRVSRFPVEDEEENIIFNPTMLLSQPTGENLTIEGVEFEEGKAKIIKNYNGAGANELFIKDFYSGIRQATEEEIEFARRKSEAAEEEVEKPDWDSLPIEELIERHNANPKAENFIFDGKKLEMYFRPGYDWYRGISGSGYIGEIINTRNTNEIDTNPLNHTREVWIRLNEGGETGWIVDRKEENRNFIRDTFNLPVGIKNWLIKIAETFSTEELTEETKELENAECLYITGSSISELNKANENVVVGINVKYSSYFVFDKAEIAEYLKRSLGGYSGVVVVDGCYELKNEAEVRNLLRGKSKSIPLSLKSIEQAVTAIEDLLAENKAIVKYLPKEFTIEKVKEYLQESENGTELKQRQQEIEAIIQTKIEKQEGKKGLIDRIKKKLWENAVPNSKLEEIEAFYNWEQKLDLLSDSEENLVNAERDLQAGIEEIVERRGNNRRITPEPLSEEEYELRQGYRAEECYVEGFLTDDLINAYYQKIQNNEDILDAHDYHLVNPIDTTLIQENLRIPDEVRNKLEAVINGVRNRPVIFFPINNREEGEISGWHWTLLVYESESKNFYYYDSLRGAVNNTAQLIAGLLETDPNIRTDLGVPYQGSKADCGFYVLSIIETLINKLHIKKILRWQVFQ